MRKKPIIAVIGHDRHAKKIHLKIAEEIGREIAKRGGIVICGGTNRGVPNAVAKGAREMGGVAIGILPREDNSETSKYVTVPILTGMGFARNQILGFSSDAVIAVGGGVGTFCEMAYAYAYSKPIIAIVGMGGFPDKFVNKYLDDKRTVKIVGAKSAGEAVELAFKLSKNQ